MNENKSNKYHVGKAIYAKFIKSGLSSKEFAEELNCTTNEVYNIFKSSAINIERLIEVSKTLKHNFLFDIAVMIEEGTYKTSSLDENLSEESLITLSNEQLYEVDMEGYSTILDEYLVTDHKQPLIVITDVNDTADDLLYIKAFELYGNRGYKMMTNTCNIDLKPYIVPVFTEIDEGLCHKDLDTQIGEVIAAKRASDKHIVFILNMQDKNNETLLEDANQIYELWHHTAHVVFLHSSTPSTNGL